MYARDPQTLDAIISMNRNLEGGLMMANESKQVYALKDQIVQLSEQVNTLAKRELQRISTFSPLRGSGVKKEPLCFNCQNKGHMA